MKKMTLNERLAQQEELKNKPIPRTDDNQRDKHSAAFRRHFRDYVEFTEVDEEGRSHIRRVYQGMWYIPSLSLKERRREQLWLVLLYLLGLGLFLAASLYTVPANRLWFLGVAQFFGIAAAAYTLTGLYNYLTAGEKLTETDHSSGPMRVRRGLVAMAAALLLCAALYVSCIFQYKPFTRPLLLCAGLSLLSALALFAANRLDSRIVYTRQRSTEEAPDDAQRIE